MRAVAGFVPAGSRVIDVGTDHARIPVWLVQTGRANHVWASDLRSGPLRSAAALIGETGTGSRIKLRQTDGLQGFGPEDGDTVILAGMGGETMVSILSAAAWTKEGSLLILQPQSKQDVLRRFLWENGYVVRREALVKDAGRIYPILLAQGGLSPAYSRVELYTGRREQIAGDPLFGEFLAGLIRRAEAAAPYDAEAAALLAEFKSMEEERQSCRP